MKKLLKYFIYLKPYYNYLFLAILLMWLISIFSLAFPFLTQIIIDNIIINRDTSLLFWVFIGMIGAKLIVGIISALRNYVLAYIGNKISLSLSFDFIDHIIHLPFSFFDDKKMGEIQNRIGDSRTIQTLISSIILDLGTDLISLFVYIIVLYFMNVTLAIAVTITIPFYILNSKVFNPYFRKKSQVSWEKSSRLGSESYELLSGIRVVKTFALEKRFLRKLKYFTMDAMNLNMEMGLVGSLQYMLTDFAGAMGTFIVYFLGAYQIMNNHMTIGGLIAFVSIMPNVFSPLSRLVNMNSRIQASINAVDRFDSLWNTKIEEERFSDNKNQLLQVALKGNIELKNISYAYKENNYVLKNISLSIPNGKMIALVGRSGSGKTTLTNLIPGFYIPQIGDVLFDDINLKDIDIKNLRRQIGFVQQEPFLFSGSIKDNITLGLPYYNDNDVAEAARLAGAYDFIQYLPEKFATEVGEKGVRLSVGQKQRITIARVFLMDPKVLILDEPTSALDLESEKLIQEAMKTMSKDRTTIIIAHRLSTIRDADQIVVLDNGNIVEIGNHEELISKKGHYYSLYNLMGRI